MTLLEQKLFSIGDRDLDRFNELEDIVSGNPFSFIDTQIFLRLTSGSDLVSMVMDTPNYRDLSILDIEKYCSLIKRHLTFAQEYPYFVTKSIITELRKTSRLFGHCLRYYNKSAKRLSRGRYRDFVKRREIVLSKLNDFGFTFHRLIKKLRHKVHVPQGKDDFEGLVGMFKHFYDSGDIEIKERKLNRRMTERKMGDTMTDSRLVAHTLYVSIVQRKPVAIISNDQDMKLFIKMGIDFLTKDGRLSESFSSRCRGSFIDNPMRIFSNDGYGFYCSFNSLGYVKRLPIRLITNGVS